MRATLSLTTTIFLCTVLALAIPFILLTTADTGTFSASATVGNQAPNISVAAGIAATGNAASTANITIVFNVTDPNGVSDLNDSSVDVNISRAGETTRTLDACGTSDIDTDTRQYSCNVSFFFYDGAGAWDINVSIQDNSRAYAANLSEQTATINTLDAVTVVKGSIAFSGSPGTNNIAADENPQRLNNSGNVNYGSINLTGFAFASGSDFIGVGNVTVNTTDSGGNGQVLANNTEVLLVNTTLNKGAASTSKMYFWLDIPAGQAPATYNSQSNWILEANT